MTILLIMISYILGIIWGLYIKNIVLIFLVLLILTLSYLIKKHLLTRFKIASKRIKNNEKLRTNHTLNLKKMILMLIVFSISLINILSLENSFNNEYKTIYESAKIEAIVVSNCKEKEYKNEYKIKIESINGNKDFSNTCLLLSMKDKKQKIEYGDKIFFLGEFEKASEARNNGGFNYKQYLKTNGIYGLISTTKIEKIQKGQYYKILIFINNVRNKIIENANKLLSKNEANLLTGILIGNKDSLDKTIQQDFRNSSLSHMLAVSGAHASYVIIGITIILGKLNISKNFSKIITIILLILFTILTGATSSVTRAVIMAIYLLLGSLLHRKPNIIASISLSLFIILIINPYKILDVGLQLSYGGTIGIIMFSSLILKERKYKNKILNTLKDLFVVSLSANIVIFPIIAYHYNTFSITFFISNILAGPLLGIIIILGFVTIILSFIAINLARIPAFILSIFLKLLIHIASFSSKLPLSKIYVITPSIIFILIYYFILFLIRFKKFKLKKILDKRFISILLCVFLIFQLIKIIPSNLQINFIDVGQGDSTLIITPMHKTILIDGGGNLDEKDYSIGKNVLIPYLLDKGIIKLDYIMISHFDSDHVGGILTVMEELKVGQVVISKQGEDSENYKKFKETAKEKKIKVVIVGKGDRLQIEKGLYFDILWPNNTKLISENILNNNSIVAKLNYKNTSCIFTGDIEAIAERQLLQEYKNNLNIFIGTILKVGHHGSKTSSIQEFIETVKPKISLIGVGEDNKFGHPNNEVIHRLEKIGSQIYRTDQMGEITIIINRRGAIYIKKFIEYEKMIN